MLWLFVLLMLLYAAFLKGTVQADLRSCETGELRLFLRIGFFRRARKYQLHRTAQGHLLTRTDSHGTRTVDPLQLRQSRGSLFADALRRADRARHFLLAHLYLDRLDGLILLRTGDAAASALVSGGLQGALNGIPAVRRRHIRIRVLPEFFRAHSTVHARCIIRFRLGTIILTAGLLLASLLHQLRLKESEATNYGTSYR